VIGEQFGFCKRSMSQFTNYISYIMEGQFGTCTQQRIQPNNEVRTTLTTI